MLDRHSRAGRGGLRVAQRGTRGEREARQRLRDYTARQMSTAYAVPAGKFVLLPNAVDGIAAEAGTTKPTL